MKSGFTFIELIIVMGVFALTIALFSLNYFSSTSKTSLGATEDLLIADLKSQQARAMSGEGQNGVQVTGWGIRLDNNSSYVMIPDNYTVTLPTGMSITTTFQGNTINFLRGSGEISSFMQNQDTLTLSFAGDSRIIKLNQYGVIIAK